MLNTNENKSVDVGTKDRSGRRRRLLSVLLGATALSSLAVIHACAQGFPTSTPELPPSATPQGSFAPLPTTFTRLEMINGVATAITPLATTLGSQAFGISDLSSSGGLLVAGEFDTIKSNPTFAPTAFSIPVVFNFGSGATTYNVLPLLPNAIQADGLNGTVNGNTVTVNSSLSSYNAYGEALGTDPQGNAVVGYSYTVNAAFQGVAHAVLWYDAAAQGATNPNILAFDLGTLPGGFNSIARGVTTTANGITIAVGNSGMTNGQNNAHATAWYLTGVANTATAGGNPVFDSTATTAGTGTVFLGDLNTTNAYSKAYGISADGNVIVGQSYVNPILGDTIDHAVWWANWGGGAVGTGANDLGVIAGGTASALKSSAYAVSGDGTLIVGSSQVPNYTSTNNAGGTFTPFHAVKWTVAAGVAGSATDIMTVGGVVAPASGLTNFGAIQGVTGSGRTVQESVARGVSNTGAVVGTATDYITFSTASTRGSVRNFVFGGTV